MLTDPNGMPIHPCTLPAKFAELPSQLLPDQVVILHLLSPVSTLKDAPGRLIKQESPDPEMAGLAEEPSQLLPDQVVILMLSLRDERGVASAVVVRARTPMAARGRNWWSCILLEVWFEVSLEIEMKIEVL